MKLSNVFAPACSLLLTVAVSNPVGLAGDYPIVDTGQERCHNAAHEVAYPRPGGASFGQDAQYQGRQPSYRDNGDGTVTDLVTGLMWQEAPGAKTTLRQALAGASSCRLGGHRDWRLPTIKELYSLILFTGTDPEPRSADSGRQRPFIDTRYSVFRYGDPAGGERIIDSQYATCTRYVSTTMHGDDTMFGVNFADGRIKGNPITDPGSRREKTFYVMYVRGNPDYGKNRFHDNGDGTFSDRATGLTWMKQDSGHLKAGSKRDGRLSWQPALDWAEKLDYAGHSDWRLPNVKELESIVDYTRSPATTRSAAIDPVFDVTPIKTEGGRVDFPFYWSSTTHASLSNGASAACVAFGRSPGWMPSFRGGGVTAKTSGPDVVMPGQQPMGPGMAPGQGRGPGGRPRFVPRLDRNHDGKVSREELRWPAPRVRSPRPQPRRLPDRGRSPAASATRNPPRPLPAASRQSGHRQAAPACKSRVRPLI